jgi:hypothetical protein
MSNYDPAKVSPRPWELTETGFKMGEVIVQRPHQHDCDYCKHGFAHLIHCVNAHDGLTALVGEFCEIWDKGKTKEEMVAKLAMLTIKARTKAALEDLI